MPWPEGFTPQIPWVDVEEIIKYHARLPRPEGEKPWVNRFALEAAVYGALQTIGGEDAYKTLFDKIAAMVLSINHRHCFGDGNKRSSFIAAVLCLNLNGFYIDNSSEVEEFFWKIGKGEEDIHSIASWLQRMKLENPEPERVSTRIIEGLGFFE